MSAKITLPEHLTVNEAKRAADCAVCKSGITVSPGQLGKDLLASFMVQHATHTKNGRPSGLTAGGRPTAAAREALLGASRTP